MKTGTKSVLFGVHSFWFHPITVALAWYELYGMPTFKELVCIFIHDLGYLGKPNMDGIEGEMHPYLGAELAHRWFYKNGFNWYYFVLLHSRSAAKIAGYFPSKLCWADKLCIKYDPWWFYMLRARLSGEIYEYYNDAVTSGLLPAGSTFKEWFFWARERGVRVASTENAATVY